MNIRPSTRQDVPGMLDVVRSLVPVWFKEYQHQKLMPVDFAIQRGYVAEDNGTIVGFLSYSSDHGRAIIMWFGIKDGMKGNGIGQQLLAALEEELKSIGVKKLRVDTLASSTDYEPYVLTRKFYEKMGFSVEKVTALSPPDNDRSFDMATYIKHI